MEALSFVLMEALSSTWKLANILKSDEYKNPKQIQNLKPRKPNLFKRTFFQNFQCWRKLLFHNLSVSSFVEIFHSSIGHLNLCRKEVKRITLQQKHWIPKEIKKLLQLLFEMTHCCPFDNLTFPMINQTFPRLKIYAACASRILSGTVP